MKRIINLYHIDYQINQLVQFFFDGLYYLFQTSG
jgi:hypothetical protein